MNTVIVTDKKYIVDPLFQWDQGQVLEIRGLSLAKAPEVHFDNGCLSGCVVKQATMDNAGIVTVNIPNIILQKPHKITAYICDCSTDKFKSLYSIEIPVKPRKKPEFYEVVDEYEIYSIQALTNEVINKLGNLREEYDRLNDVLEEDRQILEEAIENYENATAVTGVEIATTERAGLVKPDGETIVVEEDGTIRAVGGGTPGTVNYEELKNKPSINGTELRGNKSLEELGIASAEELSKTTQKVDTLIEKADLGFKETASGENIHLTDSAESKVVEFALYGKATQDGTPTPENPVDIVVSGESYNIIPYPYFNTALTQGGVTWTDNGDGIIVANGKATATSFFTICSIEPNIADKVFKPNTRYILSMEIKNAKNISIYVNVNSGDIAKIANKADGYYEVEFTTPSSYSTKFTVAFYRNADGQTEDNCIVKPMIRKASVKNDRYMPYGVNRVGVKSENEDNTRSIISTILTPNGLAGIPVDSGGNYTDSNGQQWICDEIVKYADGTGEKVQRTNKIILDGSSDESWNYEATNKRFILNKVPYTKTENIRKYVLCSHALFSKSSHEYGIVFVYNTDLFFYKSDLTNINDLKTWIATNPITVVYELSEPIRTPLTAEEIAEIEKLHTFYPITNISNDFDCGMSVKYLCDSKNYIDNQLALQAQAREDEMLAMFLLLPEETQAKMIENDTNNLLLESEI